MTSAEEIKKMEELQGTGEQEFSPYKNPKAISIIEMPDGNFKLFAQKHGKMVEIRSGKPQDAVGEFIIHE
jgi:uncharacterized membrane protein (UPF0127 family)